MTLRSNTKLQSMCHNSLTLDAFHIEGQPLAALAAHLTRCPLTTYTRVVPGVAKCAHSELMYAAFHDPDGKAIKVFAAPDTP